MPLKTTILSLLELVQQLGGKLIDQTQYMHTNFREKSGNKTFAIEVSRDTDINTIMESVPAASRSYINKSSIVIIFDITEQFINSPEYHISELSGQTRLFEIVVRKSNVNINLSVI